MTRYNAWLVALAFYAPELGAQDHHHAGSPGEELGRVAFPVSCSVEARQRFERAAALLHSFWWDASAQEFDAVAEADPTCAMAYWGKAMTSMGNPFAGAPAPEALRAGLTAIEKAVSVNPPTARERGYIEALAAFYRAHDVVDHRARATAYEAAMEALASRHRDDPEAAIFHARAIVANTPTTDKSFERQKRAGAILSPLFRKYPDHPGLAHYLIHTYDAPPIAHLGANAARQYSLIAPSAPHAQHMPSHIFTRLGMWQASIEANSGSAAAARRSEEAQRMKTVSMDRAHAWDYLVYAYLQRGQDESARRFVLEAASLPPSANLAAYYARAAIPARYALERGEWSEAARLAPERTPAFPQAEGVTYFARGIGAARSGDPGAARAAVAALAALRDTLVQRKESEWARRVDAQRLAVAAWIAHSDGNAAEAVRMATEAAEIEELVDKHPVMPGPILPGRELLGDLLLVMNRPAEALRAYEAALRTEPNRSRATFGAARAAQLAGKPRTARARYAEYLRLMADADADRAEVGAARSFLSSR